MTELDGMVAVVTGGGSGIGAALVGLLAGRGASVMAADVDADGLARVAEATGCSTRVVDVRSERDNAGLMAAAAEAGGLDLVFLNAGILGRSMAEQQEPVDPSTLGADRYRAVLGVNVDGVVFGTLAAAQAMTGGGAIVATASVAGLVPWAPDPVYTLTKHAVVGWVRAMAPTLGASGITIDAICPGGVATPMVGARPQDDIPALALSPSQVAEAMLATALEAETGRAVSVVSGREPVWMAHEFASIEGFGMPRRAPETPGG